MLSALVNKTSNSNFEATSVLNMERQSHRLLVLFFFFFFFFFFLSLRRQRGEKISMCTPVEVNIFQSSLLSSCTIVHFKLLRTPFCHVVSLQK